FYLVLTITNKFAAEAVFTNALHQAGKSVNHITAYPTPLNNVLWYVVAEEPSGFDMGYYSLFTSFDTPIQFQYIPKNHRLIREAEDQKVIDRMRWVSKNQFVLENRDGNLLWHDLRFGLLNGLNPAAQHPEYVFSYRMIKEDSIYVDIEQIQPDNLTKLRQESLPAIWRGIWGK
ncbi:MAG: hypothetical protein AAFV07_14935, partial [Bacteroidota bacterium]